MRGRPGASHTACPHQSQLLTQRARKVSGNKPARGSITSQGRLLSMHSQQVAICTGTVTKRVLRLPEFVWPAPDSMGGDQTIDIVDTEFVSLVPGHSR